MTCNEEINFRDNSSIEQACELIVKQAMSKPIELSALEKVIEKLKRLYKKVLF